MKMIIMYINMLCLLAATSLAAIETGGSLAVAANCQESSFITGRVAERKTGLPVGKVIVRWAGSSDAVLSRADGSYRIASQAGMKKLVFSKPGWVEKTSRISKKGNTDIRFKKKKLRPLPPQPEEDLPPDTIRLNEKP